MTTTFKVGDSVCIGSSSSPGTIVAILSNGVAELEWPDKGMKWATFYSVDELKPLISGSKRQRNKPNRLVEKEAPNKKIKKAKRNGTRKKETTTTAGTVKNPADGKPNAHSSSNDSNDKEVLAEARAAREARTVSISGNESDSTSQESSNADASDDSGNESDSAASQESFDADANDISGNESDSDTPQESSGPDANDARTVTEEEREEEEEDEVTEEEEQKQHPEDPVVTIPKPATKHAVPDLWEVTGVDKDKGLKEIANILPKRLKKSKEQVAHFFLFCYERQLVWERRNRGEEQPFTNSVAMHEYFFCNNYRELDRGTNYFRSHILSLWDKYNKDGPVGYDTWIELVLWASLCYRLVNRISTFEEFGCIPEVADWPRFKRFMNKAVRSGTKVFTDAHITGGLKPFLRNMEMVHEKDAQLVKEVSEQVLESVHKGSLEGCFDAVKTINGAGNFTAWQVVCDLMESQCLSPCTEDDWTELGPGAKGGIDIIFGAGKNKNYLGLAMLLRRVQDDVFDALGIKFPRWNGVPLTLKNIEHPLCEFKKYNDIHGNLRKSQRFSGQRLIKSRAEMDLGKACLFVDFCGEHEDILLCDKCLVGFCEDCAPRDSSPDYWVCPRCTELEAISFED